MRKSELIYEGIDFANIEGNIGHCYLYDDGVRISLSLTRSNESDAIQRRAVDCPLGVSWGFAQLIQGSLPLDVGEDGYKTRETERWLRGHAAAYATNKLWLNRSVAERERYPRRSYFNGGAHIQSAAGLQIVPSCFAWLLKQLAPHEQREKRLSSAIAARRGEAHIVEAHPRMFLYSAIERLHQTLRVPITVELLDAVAGYKESGAVAIERRLTIYSLLQANPVWMGQVQRQLLPVVPPDQLIESDHKFDAWLAAFTAWAHDNNETLCWKTARIDESRVNAEGHILILK